MMNILLTRQCCKRGPFENFHLIVANKFQERKFVNKIRLSIWFHWMVLYLGSWRHDSKRFLLKCLHWIGQRGQLICYTGRKIVFIPEANASSSHWISYNESEKLSLFSFDFWNFQDLWSRLSMLHQIEQSHFMFSQCTILKMRHIVRLSTCFHHFHSPNYIPFLHCREIAITRGTSDVQHSTPSRENFSHRLHRPPYKLPYMKTQKVHLESFTFHTSRY